MQTVKLLVLDFDHTDPSSNDLRQIPASSRHLRVQSRYEVLSYGPDKPLEEQRIREMLTSSQPDIILLALPPALPPEMELLFEFFKTEAPGTPLLIVNNAYDPEKMIALLNMGARDFITPPFKEQDLCVRFLRVLEIESAEEKLIKNLKEKMGLKRLIGRSAAFSAEIDKIPVIAKCDAGVLISGETGTGKELCARAIHYLSPRAHAPFLPVNCGAIPADLIENELFGHVPGAFTGATHAKPGLIQEADQGTLFLDEIDCLTPAAQVKLLRFLQEKEYRRLGATRICQADVRVIAATNQDIVEAVQSGKIRQDLYYRLDIIPLTLPPLRERLDDIPVLAAHFLDKYNRELHKQVRSFHLQAMQQLLLHDWPGNVRELEYVIERAVLFCEDQVIKAADLVFPRLNRRPAPENFKAAKNKVIDDFERSYIQGLLRLHQGNISQASKAAQKNRRAFWQLMHKHHIDAEAFRSAP